MSDLPIDVGTLPGNPKYLMPPPFLAWLENRSREASAADRLAFQVARSGPAGVSLDGFLRSIRISTETMQDSAEGPGDDGAGGDGEGQRGDGLSGEGVKERLPLTPSTP